MNIHRREERLLSAWEIKRGFKGKILKLGTEGKPEFGVTEIGRRKEDI